MVNTNVFILDDQPSYVHAIIETILEILKVKSAEKHKDVAEGIITVIPHIFTKAIQASLDSRHNLILNRYILQTLSLITMTIFSKADSVTQKAFVDKTFKLFVDGDLSQFNIETTAEYKPLQTTSLDTQKETCQLFAAIVCALRKDVVLPISNLEDYLNDLVTLALSSDNKAQITCASRIIGSIINKWKDSKLLHHLSDLKNFI